MKRFVGLIIAIILVFGINTLSYADPISTSKNILLSLTTSGAFGFEVWDTELDQNLGSITPGQAAFADIHIYATSSHALQWTISANSDGLVGTTQPTPDTLPVKMSTFDGGGVGLTGAIVDNLTLTASPQAIYTAGTGEYPVLGLQVSGLCIIETAPSIQEDLYEGMVQLTMTE